MTSSKYDLYRDGFTFLPADELKDFSVYQDEVFRLVTDLRELVLHEKQALNNVVIAAEKPYGCQLYVFNGFVRLYLGQDLLHHAHRDPDYLNNFVTTGSFVPTIGATTTSLDQHRTLSSDGSILFSALLRDRISAIRELLGVTGFTDEDIEHATTKEHDGKLIAGFTFYVPESTIAGLEHRDDLHDGIFGSTQLSPEDDIWELGPDREHMRNVIQHYGETILMNCLDEADDAQETTHHIIHRPLVGKNFRAAFIWSASGDLARRILGRLSITPYVHNGSDSPALFGDRNL